MTVRGWHNRSTSCAVLPAWLRPVKRQLIRWGARYREFRTLLGAPVGRTGAPGPGVVQAIAADFQRLHGVRAERIRVVHNGVDTARFSPDHRATYRDGFRRKLRIGDQDTAFLFVGHDGVRKGLSTAIRALGRLVAEGHRAKLIVVGGRRLKPYVRLARQCRVADQVQFAGAVEKPGPYYAAADAFVLPTFYDPCSLSVLEAMAAGLPSITTGQRGGGTDDGRGPRADSLRPGRRSTIGEPDGPARRSCATRGHGPSGRELALDCTFERNCDKILDIYEEIVAAKSESGIRRLPASAGPLLHEAIPA